tara:strand:+ start:180 stop:344 length:165 start_codon:yes stop_codon:yes gene_type:complete
MIQVSLTNQMCMAKRSTGVEKGKKSHSRKTAKRLQIKRVLLKQKAEKRNRTKNK